MLYDFKNYIKLNLKVIQLKNNYQNYDRTFILCQFIF